jgi:L,D-peptidoglycan transpeptidase YkuD (ErfK/YbiS/YcfS/YnhG family)
MVRVAMMRAPVGVSPAVLSVCHAGLKGFTVTSLAIMAQSRPRDSGRVAPAARRRPAHSPFSLAPDMPATVIIVRAKPGDRTKGVLRAKWLTLACALGRSGIGAPKREGDGKTPHGVMRLLFAMVDKRRWPAAWGRPWVIGGKEALGWCDWPADANYNRAVRLPHRASHEMLARADHLYDCVIVLDWNVTNRARNRGSAIFIHAARDGYAPTEGCIALAPRDLARLLGVIRPGSIVRTA